MQRLCALVLVSCMHVFLLLPFVPQADASALPQCCRRSGAHKCAMMMGGSSAPDSASKQSIGVRCPFDHGSRAQAAVRGVSLPAPAQAVFTELLAHPAVRPQTEARLRVSYLRSRQKRGPPSFSIC